MRLLTLHVPPGIDVPVEPGDLVEVIDVETGRPVAAEVVEIVLSGLIATLTLAVIDER